MSEKQSVQYYYEAGVRIDPRKGVSVKPLAKPAAETSCQDPDHVLVKDNNEDPLLEIWNLPALT